MSETPLQVQIQLFRDGTTSFDGAVSPIVVVPTTVFLRKTHGTQIAVARAAAVSI